LDTFNDRRFFTEKRFTVGFFVYRIASFLGSARMKK